MSKLINQTRLNQFTTKIWSKIKEKYNVSFKAVILTDDKKLKFTKIEGTDTVDIDLVEYARLKDKNDFKQDVSADNVIILSNRQIGDPNSNTSENRSLGFRGLTNNSFVDGYVSELVILVDSDASVGSQTTWNVWAIKKGETRDRDTVKKLIQQNGSNDIRVNVQSFNDNGTTRKYVIIPINEGFTEEVYFIIRSQNTRCNVRTNIDSKYHPDVVNMSRDQPPMNQGELINWGSNSTNNTAIMYLRGRESIGSLHNKINKLNSDSGLYVKQEETTNTGGTTDKANKVVRLDNNGKLNKNMLPSIAINEYFSIEQFTHDKLNEIKEQFENGDVVVVTGSGADHGKRFLCVDKEHNLTNLVGGFVELNSKDGVVKSVDGKIGDVVLNLVATENSLKLTIGNGTGDAVEKSVPIVTEGDIDSIIAGLQ